MTPNPAEKIKRVRALLEAQGLDGVILRRNSSMSWVTDGAALYINTATHHGIAQILVTKKDAHLFTTNIEDPRLRVEEGPLEANFTVHGEPWYEYSKAPPQYTKGLKLGSDDPANGEVNVNGAISELRSVLTPAECVRYRNLGKICAEAMNEAIASVRPGQSEFEIAGRLAHATYDRGALPIVALIATDERIFKFRHPLPVNKKVNSYAMLVLCGRQYGLVCSVTRLVHFGRLSDELKRKQDAVLRIDATFNTRTRPGVKAAEVFKAAQDAYKAGGFDGEWKLHHQGGAAGYEPREWVGRPEAPETVHLHQAYAWNPSITGVKTEDTILVGEKENEVLTQISGWPMQEVEVGGVKMRRPLVRVVE